MDMKIGRNIRGLLFDKDGTLFDFHKSWSSWMATIIGELSGGDAAAADRVGRNLGFDVAACRFLVGSPFVAGTPDTTVGILQQTFPNLARQDIVEVLRDATMQLQQVEVVPLRPLILELANSGLTLGIATNDHESTARMHLEQVGVLDHLEFVAGFDSGHGSKPEAGMLLAFCEQTGINPGQVAMVGDSIWDIQAGMTAGMATVGVLTGTATSQMLSPLADVVLCDIGELPAWLQSEAATGT